MSLEGMHPIKKSALPRYYQLKEIIRSRIRNRKWQAGDLLPSERDFCEQYGMSRTGSPTHLIQVTVYTERDQPILYGRSIYRNTSIKMLRDTSIAYPVYSFH